MNEVHINLDYLERVDDLLVTLTKNAAHCYGIDFGVLNETLIDTSRLLREAREARDTGQSLDAI
ncbi:MAG: hypothetical protein RBU21_02975 [FCB group bacterium]|nr:hypothetical protein [FCB group bacterium]